MGITVALAAGLAIGLVVGLLGAGGGILSVPILVYVLGQAPHNATTGSLIIILISALTALWAHWRSGNMKLTAGLLFGAFSVVFSFLGARVAPALPADLLMVLFGVLLLLTGVYMAARGLRQRREEKYGIDSNGFAPPVARKKSWRMVIELTFAGATVGFLSGIFGLGGGFAVVPLLVAIFGFSMREAAATSVLVLAVTSIAGLLGRIGTPVSIDWPIILTFAGGASLGALGGEPLGRKAHQSTLTLAFGGLTLAMGIATVAQSVL